ncbi:hypothetical protein [Wenyingzhuangia marina]|uniref:Uncharacterized protein n=1 Tax=Wenyingzhuangia marina TaxID=1195760 RepID=A0A1M5U3V2_9FLAO|nr:hypothetical protein [Wenyingzhuangia marina]SHH57544.1 hypothetical protein SAMN05444281_1012 [Wenyingzhuangia marina]SHH57639.1 hypothetical protein SAMN05444281_1017 [Wenyingzhuangia marina]
MKKIVENTGEFIVKYNEKFSEFEDKYPNVSSSIRSVVGIFPVGTLITELAVDNYSRRKQTRINKFIEYFIQNLEKHSSEGKTFENFDNEDFEDIFEGILFRVHRIKSEEKKQYFAKILAETIFLENKNHDFIETFLDLIERLNSKQIEILNHYYKQKIVMEPISFEIKENKKRIKSNNESNFEILKERNKKLQEKAVKIAQDTIDKDFNIDNISLAYHKQDLVSKSLLQDIGMDALGAQPYLYLEITDFGKIFLKYIRGY